MPERPIGVLCVESNEAVCEALRRLLRPPVFCWLGSVRGLAELDGTLDDLVPSLLVIATAGNEADAIEWVRRARGARPSLRIAMLTSDGNPDVLAEALWAGLDGLLSKLDDPATIPALLAEAAAGRQAVGPEVRRLLSSRGAVEG